MFQLFWINIFQVRQHFDFHPVDWPQTSEKRHFLLVSSTQIKRSCPIILLFYNLANIPLHAATIETQINSNTNLC